MMTRVTLIVFSVFIAHSYAQFTQEWGYRSCGRGLKCVPSHMCEDACRYNEVCCSNVKRTQLVKPYTPEKRGCGWSNSDNVGFNATVNKQSKFGEFPWTVAILRKENIGVEIMLSYTCGGSLVAPKAVLTAAHCVINRQKSELVVRAGEWDSQSNSEILNNVDMGVREIITHEEYAKGTLINDVALIILVDPFSLQYHIRPICLPQTYNNFDYSRCYVSGWGKDVFGHRGKYNKVMTKIELPVVPHDICQNNLRQTRLGKYFNLHESFLCAGGEANRDTCQGYGGSPLVCPIRGFKDRYYQAGIVAWGIECGKKDVPGVYANVPYLSSWISKKLSSKGIDYVHYTP